MKKIRYNILLTLSVLGFVSLMVGCASQETRVPITTDTAASPTTAAVNTTPTITTAAYKDVTAGEGFELIQKNSGNVSFVILDVRTPDEFNSGHIKDALNIDVNATSFEQEVDKLDKSKTYLVYCRSGRRSVDASEKMLKLGFRYVYNMTGGIIEWEAGGYFVVK